MRVIHSLVLVLAIVFVTSCKTNDFRISELRVEYTLTPLGIDEKVPRFSWKLESGERGVLQEAYEIRVAESVSALTSDKTLSWSTGKVSSSDQIHITYQGEALKPFTRYYWQVRSWNNLDQESPWSDPTWFETAMMEPSDWEAIWITDSRPLPEKDEDFYKDEPCPIFRTEFVVPNPVSSARLYICGLGYHETTINGEKVGKHVLDPGWTPYGKTVLYSTHDVTKLVQEGPNALGVMLGNGWYNPLPLKMFGRWNIRDYMTVGKPKLIAQLHIQYTDGTIQVIKSGTGWKASQGSITRNSVYLGEHQDARLEQENWSKAGFDDSQWSNAIAIEAPPGKLTSQYQPPVIVGQVIKPVAITEPSPGVYIFDMGVNFAGVARLKVEGPEGTRVKLKYGEALWEDGTLNYMTSVAGHIKEVWNLKGGPGAPPTAWQEDQYTLKGVGLEVFSPRFTFHGFRYVEVTGFPGIPTLESLEGLIMHADLEVDGQFACSNENLNKVQEITLRTFLSNVFSVQSDCPQREKYGYGADIVVTAEAYSYNFNMHQFYTKTAQDFRDDQRANGGMTEIAPHMGIDDRGFGDETGPVGWQLAFPFAQEKIYQFYGDRRIIEKHYEATKRQIEFLRSVSPDHYIEDCISDHESLDPRPPALTASAHYYHHVKSLSRFASILGRTTDQEQYARLSDEIKVAFNSRFLKPGTGVYDIGTQATQTFALWYDFAPEQEIDKVFQQLEDQLANVHGGHNRTGIFATKMMFDVFREKNRNDLAYLMANQEEFPGWIHMVKNNATTLWESWKEPDIVNSHNHPMFGSISEWFYRALLGINQEEESAGFGHIVLKPMPAGDLTWAKGHYNSVRGKIESDWKIDDQDFLFSVTIPANTRARVYVPANDLDKITESGKPLRKAKGIKILSLEHGYAVLETGSGKYSFVSRLP